MLFNATFNNISVISWWSVLLMEKTTDMSQVTDKLSHIMLYLSSTPCHELGHNHDGNSMFTDIFQLLEELKFCLKIAEYDSFFQIPVSPVFRKKNVAFQI